jgi:uncharacterized protein with NAD-binding domain and iron-sulfur cluster
MKKSKVIICGAGIGGLTVAHELAKRKFDVTIYEKNDIIGGLARSKYHLKNGKKYPVEYSWRVYGTNYRNLLRILNEIPLKKNGRKRVYSNLKKIGTYIFARFNKEEVIFSGLKSKNKINLIKNFENSDYLKILNKILYCLTMSTKRMDSLDEIKWKDFCEDLSPEAKKYIVQLFGPVLGMDTTKMSYSVIARMAGIILSGFFGYRNKLYLMNQPTNDGWFDEWLNYLKSQGVKIKTNHQIIDFKLENKKVKQIEVKNLSTGKVFMEDANEYVCGMAVEAITELVNKNSRLKTIPTFKKLVQLTQKTRQIQLSVQIFLDQKIIYPRKDDTIEYLPDTPWSLIIEPEAQIWNKTYSNDKKVKSILSVGICQTDVPGIIFGKPFTRCSRKEVEKEVWQQIVKSYQKSNIRLENGSTIDQAKIILFYIWDSFKFNQKVQVSEPKFSNNVNSLKYQPRHVTEIPNFYFATGYTKTDRYIYSMESAVEAGTLAANEIIKKNKINQLTRIYPLSTSLLFRPLIIIDKLFYKLNLPHISKFTFNSSLLLVILYLVGMILPVILLVLYLANVFI